MRLPVRALVHQGGPNQFSAEPEESSTLILGPIGIEDGNRTTNTPEAHVRDRWSRHPGGDNVLVSDGSVHFRRTSVSQPITRARRAGAGREVDPH